MPRGFRWAVSAVGHALRDRLGPSAVLYVWIAVGSGIGGAARFWCAEMAVRLLGDGFPWGILLVNVAGSLVIGFFFTYSGPDGRLLVSTTTRQFVMTGLCGGYTTFSAFSLDTLNQMRDGRIFAAGANVVMSVALCLLFAWLGHALAARLNRPARG
jgi:CrcB protein